MYMEGSTQKRLPFRTRKRRPPWDTANAPRGAPSSCRIPCRTVSHEKSSLEVMILLRVVLWRYGFTGESFAFVSIYFYCLRRELAYIEETSADNQLVAFSSNEKTIDEYVL